MEYGDFRVKQVSFEIIFSFNRLPKFGENVEWRAGED